MELSEYLSRTEKKVEKYFKNIQIISEVQLPIEHYEIIIKNFNKVLSANENKQDKVINLMWSFAPKTCLTITVYFAIYNYDGNFWGKFKEAISLRKDQIWKQKFINQLKIEKLFSFDKTSTQKFIQNILGHAGIPKNNIDSFIKSILMPAVNFNLDENEIVQAIKRDKTVGEVVKSYGLYKSVKDFISLDTEVSNSFIGRCIEVWKEHERPFVQNYKHYIPDHVLSAFDNYVDSGTFPKFQSTSRVSRPVLSYSPEHQNIYIHLPSQRFKLDQHDKVTWKIQSNESEDVISALKARSLENNEVEFYIHKMNGEYPLQPDTDYEVTLLIDEEIKGIWNFFLQDVVLFNGRTLEQERKEVVSFKDLILIVHEKHKGIIERGLNNYYSKPLFGLWGGYYEMEVNVSQKDIYHFPSRKIHMNPGRTSFILEGEVWNDIKGNTSLYKEAPCMLIKKEFIDLEEDLESWQIRLTHNWMNKSSRMSLKKALENSSLSQEGFYRIDLGYFMDEIGANFGKMSVSLTGLLGKDLRIDFICLDKDDLELSVIENLEKEIFIRTVNNLDFSITSNQEINLIDDNTKVISVTAKKPIIRAVLQSNLNHESVELKIYSSLINSEVNYGENYLALGEKVNKATFSFSGSNLILDFENPRLLNISNTVNVSIYEHIKNEEMVIKRYTLKTGRKHSINLSYFESINNTYTTRIIMLKIEEIELVDKLLILDTDWKVKSVTLVDEIPLLKWDISFIPDKVKINIWKMDNFSEPVMNEILTGETKEISLKVLSNNEAHYLFQIQEEYDNDLLSLFLDQGFPKEINDKIFPFNYPASNNDKPTYAAWLLIIDQDGNENEWEEEELRNCLENIYENQEVVLPLLLKDYDSCCDFGIQNMDYLLELFIKDEIKIEFKQFLMKVSGFQEWDLNSFNLSVNPQLSENTNINNKNDYVPIDLNSLQDLTSRERALSYQRSPQKEQLLKGFSLKHKYLAHLNELNHNEQYKESINSYLNHHYKKISLCLEFYETNNLISKSHHSILNKRITDAQFDIDFPYWIGVTAYLTSSLFYHESKLTVEMLNSIRDFSPRLMDIDQEWYLHDLIFWKQRLKEEEEILKAVKERKREYGNSSFAWKR